MPISIALHALSFVYAVTGVQGPTYTLHRKLVPGEVDRYALSMTMQQKMSMGGTGSAQGFGMSIYGDYILKVGKLRSSGREAYAEVTTTTKSMKSDFMGAPSQQLPPPMKMVGTLDTRGRFKVSHSDGGQAANFMNMMGGQSTMIELPDRPVRIGDTWTVKMPATQNLGLEMSGKGMQITLVGRGMMDGRSTWSVKLSGHTPLSADMGQFSKALSGQLGENNSPQAADVMKKMKLSGSMDYFGTGSVDQRTGKTIAMEMTISSHMIVNMTSMKMSVDGKIKAGFILKS